MHNRRLTSLVQDGHRSELFVAGLQAQMHKEWPLTGQSLDQSRLHLHHASHAAAARCLLCTATCLLGAAAAALLLKLTLGKFSGLVEELQSAQRGFIMVQGASGNQDKGFGY